MADIAQRRARGEKLLPADFNQPPIPDSQNAAVDLKRAMELLSPSGDEWSLEGKMGSAFPMSAADQKFMAKFMEAHREGYESVRRARGKSGVDWKIQFASPMIGVVDLRLSNGQKNIAEWLYLAMAASHSAGNDAAAIEYARDLLMLARACEQPPSMVSHLSVAGMIKELTDAIHRMAPSLGIIRGQPAPNLIGPAGSDQVKALIQDLLDEKAFRNGFVDACAMERAELVDTAICAESSGEFENIEGAVGDPGTALAVFAMPSLLYHEAREIVDDSEQWLFLAQQADLSTVKNQFGSLTPPSRQHSPYANRLFPALITEASVHFRVLRDRRSAAILLAERLYAFEKGHRPSRIEDLVPRYLPRILDDPLSSGTVKLSLGGAPLLPPIPASPPKK